MKFGLKHYYKPTPKKLRKLGDSLLAAATFATSFSIIMEHKVVAVVVITIGFLGKLLTNFFAEDDVCQENEK